jgi:hypothetical protein
MLLLLVNFTSLENTDMTARKFSETEIEFFLNEGRVDDLVQVVVDSESGCGSDRAAEKLIELWENGRQNNVDLHHLAYVGDHAAEPHKSRANQIIRDNM